MAQNFPLDVRLNLSEEKRFYEYTANEYTTINGNMHRSELNKTLHVILKMMEKDSFRYHIETFDRVHRDRHFSLSEKDFYSRIAEINDEVILTTDECAKLQSIDNLPFLQNKLEKIEDRYSRKYVGNFAQASFKFFRSFYQDEKKVSTDFLKVAQFGLILPKFYGLHDPEKPKKVTVRYSNLMKNTVIDVEEFLQYEEIRSDEEFVLLQYTGKIPSAKNWTMFFAEMKKENIDYNADTDFPKLEKYKGQILLDSRTKIVLEHKLTLEFSLGENYQKKIIWHLKEVSHEKI